MEPTSSWVDHVVLILVGILLAPLQILATPFFIGFIVLDTTRKRRPSPYSL